MLYQRLKDLRRQENMSQKNLADRLHMSQQAIAKWESNRSTPDPETLVRIAEVFGVTVDSLVGRPQIQPATGDGSGLSADEAELIARYRNAPAEIRRAIDRIVAD